MGYRNREIERKFILPDATYEGAIQTVAQVLGTWESIIDDASRDYYWKVPQNLNADFLRLRFMPAGTGQLTIKQADRGDNTNRVEFDVEVTEPEHCRKMLTHLMGEPTGSIYKQYYVFFLENQDTTVSIYRVRGDKRIFCEVEARTLARVEQLVKQIGAKMTMTPETRSLFQIFMEEKVA